MGTYAALRPQLRSGDLVFFREHTFWAKVIRAATRSDYCHVAVVWIDPGGEPYLIEARFGPGVSMRPLRDALPCDWISTGCQWSSAIEQSFLMKVGARYSIIAAIALGLGIRPPGQAEACSLLATGIEAGLPGVHFDRKGMTPGNLAETFLAAGCALRTLN